MFTDAKSMMFYAYGLIDKFETKFNGTVTTVCPPTADTTDEQSYNRAIHLSLKFVYPNLGTNVVYYVAFRFTFPRRGVPSQFSSIEVFDSTYTSVLKIKYSDYFREDYTYQYQFYLFSTEFEDRFFNNILTNSEPEQEVVPEGIPF